MKNLLVNPSFDGDAGWTITGSVLFGPEYSADGTHGAALLGVLTPPFPGTPQSARLTQVVQVEANRMYVIGVHARRDDGIGGLRVLIEDTPLLAVDPSDGFVHAQKFWSPSESGSVRFVIEAEAVSAWSVDDAEFLFEEPEMSILLTERAVETVKGLLAAYLDTELRAIEAERGGVQLGSVDLLTTEDREMFTADVLQIEVFESGPATFPATDVEVSSLRPDHPVLTNDTPITVQIAVRNWDDASVSDHENRARRIGAAVVRVLKKYGASSAVLSTYGSHLVTPESAEHLSVADGGMAQIAVTCRVRAREEV